MMEYTYKTKDPSIEKINYSYAKFCGVELLHAYFTYRNSYIIGGVKNEQSLEKIFIKEENSNLIFEDVAYISVHHFLPLYLQSPDLETNKFNLLIKRFEVTKKIFSFYDENLRAPEIYKTTLKYKDFLAFSYTLSEIFARSKNVKYLNSLLKVNDILCSVATLLNDEEKNQFSVILKREINFVKNLHEEFNINI